MRNFDTLKDVDLGIKIRDTLRVFLGFHMIWVTLIVISHSYVYDNFAVSMHNEYDKTQEFSSNGASTVWFYGF